MNAYEIQVYHNGKWEFDSYFNDRDLVLSEAERMGISGRYSGVRVLEEKYNEQTNRSDCRVIFSRLAKHMGPESDWRERAQRPSAGGAQSERPQEQARRVSGPRGASKPQKKTNFFGLVGIGIVLVLVGIGIIIAIREFAGIA